MPTSCSSAARTSTSSASASRPEPRGRRRPRARRRRRRSPLRSAITLREQVARLAAAGRRGGGACARTCARRRAAAPRWRRSRPRGGRRGRGEAVMLKPSPCSLRALRRRRRSWRDRRSSAPVEQQAELVAAEPVGAADGGQRGREPAQQRVAGGVAEGVVVVLEAVEVEEDERVRPCGRGLSRSSTSARRLGSSVSLSVSPRRGRRRSSREVLAAASAWPRAQRGGQRGAGEHDRAARCAWVEPGEHQQRRSPRRSRRAGSRPSPSRRARAVGRRVRCQRGDRGERQRSAPQRVQPGARRVAVAGDGDETASASAAATRPAPSSHQLAPGRQPVAAKRDEHDHQQQQVADEVAERDTRRCALWHRVERGRRRARPSAGPAEPVEHSQAVHGRSGCAAARDQRVGAGTRGRQRSRRRRRPQPATGPARRRRPQRESEAHQRPSRASRHGDDAPAGERRARRARPERSQSAPARAGASARDAAHAGEQRARTAHGGWRALGTAPGSAAGAGLRSSVRWRSRPSRITTSSPSRRSRRSSCSSTSCSCSRSRRSPR